MQNPVGWFEIYVQDLQRAKAFYEAVLVVKLEKLEAPGSSPVDMWAFPMQQGGTGAAVPDRAIFQMQGGEGERRFGLKRQRDHALRVGNGEYIAAVGTEMWMHHLHVANREVEVRLGEVRAALGDARNTRQRDVAPGQAAMIIGIGDPQMA